MFFQLLITTFVIAAAVSTLAALLFMKPVKKVMGKLVSEELAPVWQKYVLFAIYVVGISGGVRLGGMEKYITPGEDNKILELTRDRWILEIYKTVISSLESIAWMLLIFFLFALLAYVVVRGFETRKAPEKAEKG